MGKMSSVQNNAYGITHPKVPLLLKPAASVVAAVMQGLGLNGKVR